MTVSSLGQLARYSTVGLANTALSLGLDALLLRLGLPLLAASALAFSAGACSGYTLNRRWTFAARGSAASGGLYLAVAATGLVLDSVLVRLFAAAGLRPFDAFLLALPLVSLATFGANRRLTFRDALRGYA